MTKAVLSAGAICAALLVSGSTEPTFRVPLPHLTDVQLHSASQRSFDEISARQPLPAATARIRAITRAPCAARTVTPPRPEDPSALLNAFDNVVGGSATIAVYLDARGHPIAEDVTSYSDDGFRAAASRVLAAWQFIPARCDGHPVAGRYVVRFNA
jgi:hypothetical protein